MRSSPKVQSEPSARVLFLASFLVTLLAVGAAVATAAQPGDDLPGAAFEPRELARDLPWTFEVSVEVSVAAGKVQGEVQAEGEEDRGLREERRYRFESTEPAAVAGAGATYLRFELTVSRFDDPAAAEAAFERLLAEADPDTGLSYAWDRLLVRDARLYRLHAPCLFSEENFERIASRLESGLRGKPATPSRSARCRCGAGCRAMPPHD